jgi:TonB family protein
MNNTDTLTPNGETSRDARRSTSTHTGLPSTRYLRRFTSSCRALVLACASLALPALASAQPDATAAPEAGQLVAPKLVSSVEPVYPEAKRQSGEAARVVLKLTLDDTGNVTEATVLESAGPEFDQAALDAAPKLVFEPATKAGKAVPARIAFSFDFKLEPGAEEPAPAPAPAVAAPKPAPAPARTATRCAASPTFPGSHDRRVSTAC